MNQLPEHGVLILLDDLGVYLIGESGIGKSEAALQLIQQGATLICDDAPEFTSGKHKQELQGNCPKGFYGQMHLRDLGIINIIKLFGKKYFKKSQRIDFVIELIKTDVHSPLDCYINTPYQQWQYDKEQFVTKKSWIIPGIQLHLFPNRNIAQIIRIAVMQFSFSDRGFS